MYRNVFTGETCRVSGVREVNGEIYVSYEKTHPLHAVKRNDMGVLEEIKEISFFKFVKPKRIFEQVYKKVKK